MRRKTAVLLLNTGTPVNHDVYSVRKFLYEFLNDKRVIDLPWFIRKILVNLVIVPFRAHRSSKLYKRLWTEEGSPLLFHGLSLQKKLQNKLGEDYIVEYASNYQYPNIKDAIAKVLKLNVNKIIVFPLFPHYASSTTGSVFEKMFRSLARENIIPSVLTVNQYYYHGSYLNAMAKLTFEYNLDSYDHILMSFHGLPLRQVAKSHNDIPCSNYDCINEVKEQNQFCYQASCYESSRLLAAKLNLKRGMYTVCFQSRISNNWLDPFTDNVISSLAREGKKRLLVISPSFTSDCLETIIEIGEDYRDLFIKNGGEELILVQSLNESDYWVDAIAEIISEK